MGFISDNLFGQGGDTGEQALAYAIGKGKQRGKAAYGAAERGFGRAYDEAYGYLEPYDVGAEAVPAYQEGIEGWQQFMGPMDYTSHPLYQALLESGTEAVNQGAAASGSLYSGARGEALRDVGQASLLTAAQQMGNERNQSMNAYQNYMAGLQNMMGMGQQTSAAQAQLGLGRADTMSDLGLSKADYLTQLEMGQAGAHMQNRANKQAQREALYGGLTSFGMNLLGQFVPPVGDAWNASFGNGQAMGGGSPSAPQQTGFLGGSASGGAAPSFSNYMGAEDGAAAILGDLTKGLF